MNSYIESQINNMIAVTKTFEQACHLAAFKNDGIVDKAEEKALKKISAASQRFIKELEKTKG